MSIDSYPEARREFVDLVRQEQTRALWFMRLPLTADIADKNADSILDHIAQKGDRSVWLRARRLKKWRLRNIK